MVKCMLQADWERAKTQLSAITIAIRAAGRSSLMSELGAAQRSLSDKRNPLQAGIELMALSDELANVPDLWHRVVMLGTELLEYPTVEKAARVHMTANRPVAVDHFF